MAKEKILQIKKGLGKLDKELNLLGDDLDQLDDEFDNLQQTENVDNSLRLKGTILRNSWKRSLRLALGQIVKWYLRLCQLSGQGMSSENHHVQGILWLSCPPGN